MPTKTISTKQAKAAITGATGLTINANGPVRIHALEGTVASTNGTSYFIQLHGTASPQSGTTIPLYSRLVVPSNAATATNGFSFVYDPEPLDTARMTNPAGGTLATNGTNTQPVYAFISSTDTVFTSVAASTQLDVVIEEVVLDYPNQTITGDASTGCDALTVFADPNPAKRLTKLQLSNNAAQLTSGTLVVGVLYQLTTFVAGDDFTNVGCPSNLSGQLFYATGTTPTTWTNSSTVSPVYFVMGFAYSGAAAGAVPMFAIPVIAQSTVIRYFNNSNIMQQQGKPVVPSTAGYYATDYTLHTGCYLKGSSTGTKLTATSSSGWYMKAWNI